MRPAAQDAKEIGDEFLALEKYVNLNYMGEWGRGVVLGWGLVLAARCPVHDWHRGCGSGRGAAAALHLACRVGGQALRLAGTERARYPPCPACLSPTFSEVPLPLPRCRAPPLQASTRS